MLDLAVVGTITRRCTDAGSIAKRLIISTSSIREGEPLRCEELDRANAD
jgi:hypothetical protein